jgi:UDP-N-acetylmuramoylalanine--D-glutamate ligase
MEDVGHIGKTAFINDSKATNADATARALAVYPDIFWIAGGKPKEGGIASLVSYFPRIRRAYLIGEAAHAFAVTLDGKAPYEMSGTLDVAVISAARDAGASDAAAPVVLLSPACASYDQFKDFEQRGDAFRAAVARLQPAPLSSSRAAS